MKEKEPDNNINTLLSEMCHAADTRLKLSYTNVKLENLRKKQSIIEFRLRDNLNISSDIIKIEQVKKIFIPISGSLGLNYSESKITFFIGKSSYLPTPFSMSNKMIFRSFLKLNGIKLSSIL